MRPAEQYIKAIFSTAPSSRSIQGKFTPEKRQLLLRIIEQDVVENKALIAGLILDRMFLDEIEELIYDVPPESLGGVCDS